MGTRRTGSPRRQHVRRYALWAGLAVGWLLPSVGCQVEYAGMTLPSGKYMHDDVQYFAPGPDFPWANTQAATQRARMRAMGIEPPPAGAIPEAMGTEPGVQQGGGRPTDINVVPQPALPPGVVPGGPVQMGPGGFGAAPPPGPGLMPGAPPVAPGGVPAPGGIPAPGVPAPGAVPAPGGAANVPPPPEPQP